MNFPTADKMGNLDVQEAISRAQQAANLASSIGKERDKSNDSVNNER